MSQPRVSPKLSRGCDDRASRHKPSRSGIDSQIQSLERMRAEERHVARLGEDHPVGRERPFGVHDRNSNAALEHASVCDEKAFGAFTFDAHLLQYGGWNPGELATGVDEHVLDA